MTASFRLYVIPDRRKGKFPCDGEECFQTAVFGLEQYDAENKAAIKHGHLCRYHAMAACEGFVGEDEE